MQKFTDIIKQFDNYIHGHELHKLRLMKGKSRQEKICIFVKKDNRMCMLLKMLVLKEGFYVLSTNFPNSKLQHNCLINNFIAPIMIVISPSFDSVDHGILMHKMQYFGYRYVVYNFIFSYLNNR